MLWSCYRVIYCCFQGSQFALIILNICEIIRFSCTRAITAVYNWEDGLCVDTLLTDEERSIRDSFREYCQEKLLTRVVNANRNECKDRIASHIR